MLSCSDLIGDPAARGGVIHGGYVLSLTAFRFRHNALNSGLIRPFQRASEYTLSMPKATERWVLFRYVGGVFTPLSKPFKTREQAEKARLKHTEREQKRIGVGLIRV